MTSNYKDLLTTHTTQGYDSSTAGELFSALSEIHRITDMKKRYVTLEASYPNDLYPAKVMVEHSTDIELLLRHVEYCVREGANHLNVVLALLGYNGACKTITGIVGGDIENPTFTISNPLLYDQRALCLFNPPVSIGNLELCNLVDALEQMISPSNSAC